MANSVHFDYSTQHAGMARVEEAADAIAGIAHSFGGLRGAASLLLAAVVAALLVAANQFVDSWTAGHVMTAWIVMWAIAFAALALLAAPLRQLAAAARARFSAFAEARRLAAEDDKLWNLALTDARVMAELSRAMSSDAAIDIRKYY